MTLDEFFAQQDRSRELYKAVEAAIGQIGPAEARVTRSQIAFRRKRGFAWAWMPGKYLRGKPAPLVLTIALYRKYLSPRWKQVLEPYPGRFIHHLELHKPEDIDIEIRGLLAEAWNLAG